MSPSSLGDAVDSVINHMMIQEKNSWWPFVDPIIDQKWDQFIHNQMTMFRDQPEDYVKPCGTLSSNLLIHWHYPTYTTTCTRFGMDADISNPCICMMFKKFRLNSDSDNDILVMEAIWKCFRVPPQSDRLKNTAPYDSQPETWCNQHTEFSNWLWTESQAKVALLISANNVQSFRARHPDVFSIELKNTKIFGRKAWVWVMMRDNRVMRIVIPSYHTEAVLRGIPSVSAQLMDVG